MDNYEQQEVQATSQVNYIRHPDGRVEFTARGLKEWELTDAIHSVEEGNKRQYEATKSLKQIAIAGDITMHLVAFVFMCCLLPSLLGFIGIRVIMSSQQGSVQNVRQ